MNFKKLTVAAALSVGIMTIGGIAKADTGAAAPICPPEPQAICPEPCAPCPTGMACPVPTQVIIPQVTCPQEVFSPLCAQPACPTGVMQTCEPIGGILPNCAPDAKVIKRQAYAFPNIGSSSVVIPKGDQIMQIGGEDEAVAYNGANNCGGPSLAPGSCGALTIYPKFQTGAASGLTPGCPVQVQQGLEIFRCKIHGTTNVLQSAFNMPSMMGAACPVSPCDPCLPIGAACPVNPCDPCAPCAPIGAACPVNPCDPCNPCQASAPMQMMPLGAACPVCPCESCTCNPCNCTPANPCGCGAPQHRTIQTSSGLQLQKTVLMPVPVATGAAAGCPVSEQFPDVSNCMTSGCDVNQLASKGILAGYPEGIYKPNQAIMRDELASALVSGLELQNVPDFQQQIFKDVPLRHWANKDIDKVYNRGLMAGYPNCLFKPDESVNRAEVLSTMAKAIPGEISECDAQAILSQYCDANQVPGWAIAPVAESLSAGLISELPDCNMIRPYDAATRAEVASMLKKLRQKLALEACPCPTGAATTIEPQIVTTTIPTLKMQFEDIITARTSQVGDPFVAKTTEPVTIDGHFYGTGSVVRGKVAEVIRPGIGQSGAIRVAFSSITSGNCETSLPSEVLSATVVCEDNPNILGRLFAFPFSWPGKVAGVAGRTVGGAALIASNTVENTLNHIANGTNELLNLKIGGKGDPCDPCATRPVGGQLGAAGRSYLQALKEPFVGVFDITKTAFSGTVGILKESGDELAYVVRPDGSRISQINPNEVLSVAFCTQ